MARRTVVAVRAVGEVNRALGRALAIGAQPGGHHSAGAVEVGGAVDVGGQRGAEPPGGREAQGVWGRHWSQGGRARALLYSRASTEKLGRGRSI
jgi:hypothetical protein